jgi:hypothetical protein
VNEVFHCRIGEDDMEQNDLRELYIDELRDLYDA